MGIPVNNALPVIEEENEPKTRSSSDIAKRILILTYLGVYAEGGDKKEIIGYLKSQQLWDAVSEDENKLFLKNKLNTKEKINVSWRSEAMYILLWAIKKLEIPVLPVEQCSITAMLDLLPPYLEPTKKFIDDATLRTTEEILDKSDLIYRIHWAARQADIDEIESPADMDTGILQEWHYAINWITYYEENWDDITTDT